MHGKCRLARTGGATEQRYKPRPDFESAKTACSNGVYEKFFHGMLDAGIALAPGAYEALFPSLALTQTEIDATVAAVRSVAATL